MNEEEIVYLEINNWGPGQDYPDEEPFLTWMGNSSQDSLLLPIFTDENWVKSSKLCVAYTTIDMSLNFCITGPKSWFMRMCPRLFAEEYKRFLREPNKRGKVISSIGTKFLPYKEKNIGTFYDTPYTNIFGKLSFKRKRFNVKEKEQNL